MFRRPFALKIFEGFCVQRWNDLVRPVDMTEMDKTSEKMIIAYLLGKKEESIGRTVDWHKIIYGGLFELLKKIVLSDIKAPVHRMIKEESPEEFRKLNSWVVQSYEDIITDKELIQLFKDYIQKKEDLNDLSFRILRAAHKLSTIREFEAIRHINPATTRLFDIERELNRDIEMFLDLKGVQSILTKQAPYEFLTIVEHLRYQVRWGQTPRIPRTSVLGHMCFVAYLTLLMIRDIKPCPRRLFGDFFSALFHDLPEAVTRDIISPVKQATLKLPDIVKKVEKKIAKRDLIPQMEPWFRDELLYFTEDEFSSRILQSGKKIRMAARDIDKFNDDRHFPIDGDIIKVADHIAAFLEADRSISYGITSDHLKQGRTRLLSKYKRDVKLHGISVSSFYKEFDI